MSISNAISQKTHILNFFSSKTSITLLTFLALTLSPIFGHIGQDEREYITKRQKLVEQAQDEYTQHTLNSHPTIAFCLSGGGSRSQIASLGFLQAANKTGLLETATHMATLSGSTWNIGPMFIRHKIWGNNPGFFSDYRQKLQERLETSLFKNINWTESIKKLITKLEKYGFLEPADFWGCLLANRFIGDLPQAGQNCTFSHIADFLEKTNYYPFPIFSSIIKEIFEEDEINTSEPDGGYDWFELTPFQAGSTLLNTFIQTKLLGSKFENDQCIKQNPELTLSFMMGVFGSAYDLNFADLLRQAIQFIPEKNPSKYILLEIIDKLIKQYNLTKLNFLPSQIYNPSYKSDKSIYQGKYISLADAGIDFDLPFPPLLQRSSQIIICCDASSDACAQGFPELKMAARYAQEHGYNFPSIDKPKQIAKNLYVFKYDDYGHQADKKTPTILYIASPISHPIAKMQYSKEEFNELCNTMHDIIMDNKNAIAQEIIEKSEQLND